MEKNFIPYEQALELRQLGFKEECLGVWQNLKSGKNLVINEEYDRIFDVPVLGADIGAPLYQQAFRWFREKHDLLPTFELLSTGWDYVIYSDIPEEVDYNDGPWNTYEEAELACLRKLIELVKQKP
jgi:hypothetical protein